MEKSSDYDIVEVFWKGGETNIQVLKIPEDRALTFIQELDCNSGISQSEYEAFIAHKCLLDIDMVGSVLISKADDGDKEEAMSRELFDIMVSVNPFMNPDALLWKKNKGIVHKDYIDGDTGYKKLEKNPLWDSDPFEDILNDVLNNPMEFFSIADEDNIYYDEEHEKYVKKVIKKEWEDTGLTINVKKYNEDVLRHLFSSTKNFIGPRSYEMFVIHKCIVNYTKLLILVDNMGVARDIPPDDVTKTIYEFCIEVNPFLSLDNVKDKYITIGRKAKTKRPETRRNSGPKKAKSTAAGAAQPAAKTKVGFSDIRKEDILSLPDRIKAHVIGQDEAVDSVVETIQVAGAGLRDPAKPLGSFIFTGETGTGKTFLSKILARTLCGSESSLIRIDCSEYSHGHEVSKLIGAPPGYISSDMGGILTNKVIEGPFSVVLFDEIEKAHSKVYDILLQVLDEGRLTDNHGTTVDFSDCVVIMTSNVGVKDVSAVSKRVGFGDVAKLTQTKKEGAIDKSLRRKFKPEFLNRLDGIVTFNTLTKEDAKRILDLEFKEISSYIKDKDIELKMSSALKNHIINKGFSREYGARALKRTLEKDVIRPLALKVLHGSVPEGSYVVLDYKKDKLDFTVNKKRYRRDTPKKREAVEVAEADIEVIE